MGIVSVIVLMALREKYVKLNAMDILKKGNVYRVVLEDSITIEEIKFVNNVPISAGIIVQGPLVINVLSVLKESSIVTETVYLSARIEHLLNDYLENARNVIHHVIPDVWEKLLIV